MGMQDAAQIKEKILFTLRRNGPGLPVHIARSVGLSILFTSAFLSELFSEKKVKMSDMRIGSSPAYFLPGQEYSLERFSQHLKSKEKDAYLLLKEKKFLKDKEQVPAIRVALREIKDFSIPFEKNAELYWRFHTSPESEFIAEKKIIPQPEKPIILPISPIIKEEPEKKAKQKELDIFDKKTEKPKRAKPAKSIKKISPTKKEDKLFNKIKEFLGKKQIEITGIEGFNKSELTLKVNESGIEKLLIAYNKKKISEADIIKAYKKAQEAKLPYMVLSLGEPSKKISSILEALKSLDSLNKIQ